MNHQYWQLSTITTNDHHYQSHFCKLFTAIFLHSSLSQPSLSTIMINHLYQPSLRTISDRGGTGIKHHYPPPFAMPYPRLRWYCFSQFLSENWGVAGCWLGGIWLGGSLWSSSGCPPLMVSPGFSIMVISSFPIVSFGFCSPGSL